MKETKKTWTSQKGFQSTSMDKEIAVKFACRNNTPDAYKISVVLEIEIESDKNLFVADQEEYHAFIEEREVLLQEGLNFEIVEIKDE